MSIFEKFGKNFFKKFEHPHLLYWKLEINGRQITLPLELFVR